MNGKLGSAKKRGLTRRFFIRNASLSYMALGITQTGFKKINNVLKLGWNVADWDYLLKPGSIKYYGHSVVLDQYGVIAPWYKEQNGQCDFRVRIAAETLKRFPWTTKKDAIAEYPHYIFTSKWKISNVGEITAVDPGDWMNGDLGQRATNIFKGLVEYYRYSGDPSAIAHLTYMGDFILDYCLTSENHSWPNFPISVPTKGKAYDRADPSGMIQLDICASIGEGILKAYQVTKNKRWFDYAKHWGDLFAEKCELNPKLAPWPRYANPESAPWKDDPRGNIQTGGVTMILAFLDELIRLGYKGKNGILEIARDAGLRYLNEQLLPKWTLDETWGFYFWDWLNETHNSSTAADVPLYLLKNKQLFPNWKNDVRNILTLFLNHTSVDASSMGDVYSGAWAYPESSSCCGKSLWYAPLLVGTAMARYGVESNDTILREMGYRQMILQTYDAHENGISEDNIDGGVIVNDDWFNIAHPLPLLWILEAIGWLPKELGASRESHLVRTSSVVDSIVYEKGKITYTTFDSPHQTIDVVRLSFNPDKIEADGQELMCKNELDENGYKVEELPNSDRIVWIRHDGQRKIIIEGKDPQEEVDHSRIDYYGDWKLKENYNDKSSSIHLTDVANSYASFSFYGNQIRIIGPVDEYGGLADVFIDEIKQIVPIDFWNPSVRHKQTLFYKNGLKTDKHTIKIVARGNSNPYSKGNRIYIGKMQYSSEEFAHNFPIGTGPLSPQRMIFGYKNRNNYTDSNGAVWYPATEIVTRLGIKKDTVDICWINRNQKEIKGTSDPELYRYGYKASDFWINVTVGPGEYGVRLKFAARQGYESNRGFNININGIRVVSQLDILKTAKGINKAVDLVFNKIKPVNGIIKIQLESVSKNLQVQRDDSDFAFIQAMEVVRGELDGGVTPITLK